MANIDIYGTLRNVTGGAVATAVQIEDETLNKSQQYLNSMFNSGKNAQGEPLTSVDVLTESDIDNIF